MAKIPTEWSKDPYQSLPPDLAPNGHGAVQRSAEFIRESPKLLSGAVGGLIAASVGVWLSMRSRRRKLAWYEKILAAGAFRHGARVLGIRSPGWRALRLR